ncbi:MAG: hypothetical protein ACLU8D_13390 [Enterocloster sp.]
MSQSYYLALHSGGGTGDGGGGIRLGIYGLLRRKLRPKAAAFLSALALAFTTET